jgi:sugar phosphate isomerase/epimerase
MAKTLTRREWLALNAGLAASVALPRAAFAEAAMPKVCVFSKHLQDLDYPALAAAVKATGADGVDLTVRPGGHVTPENLDADLPRAVDAIRTAGLDVPMVSTRLVQPTDPAGAATFKAAADNGIRFVRIGGHKYEAGGDPVQQLDAITQDCQTYAALAREHNVVAGYHNHSGELNFGAPLWDLLRVIEQVNDPHFGSNFDMGHCMAEGPFGDWDITTRALAPHAKMVAVKDFKFDGAHPRWVELGRGIVKPAGFFERLRLAGFSGPVSIHFEYDAYDDADVDGKIAQITAGVQHVRAELAKAGYGAQA